MKSLLTFTYMVSVPWFETVRSWQVEDDSQLAWLSERLLILANSPIRSILYIHWSLAFLDGMKAILRHLSLSLFSKFASQHEVLSHFMIQSNEMEVQRGLHVVLSMKGSVSHFNIRGTNKGFIHANMAESFRFSSDERVVFWAKTTESIWPSSQTDVSGSLSRNGCSAHLGPAEVQDRNSQSIVLTCLLRELVKTNLFQM